MACFVDGDVHGRSILPDRKEGMKAPFDTASRVNLKRQWPIITTASETSGSRAEDGRDLLLDGSYKVEPDVASFLVSVIIPCYNHAHYLDEAIDSVRHQTYRNAEIVVVDDGSTDETIAVAASYSEIRFVRQENAGLAAARNTGLRESRGAYLVFLDADDRLMPTALEDGLSCFHAHPECALVYGAFHWIDASGSSLGEGWAATRIYDQHYLEMLRRNYIAMHATVMYRRGPLESVGGFDPSLPACEDYDLYLRITREFPIYCHRRPVAEYRMHDANMSADSELMLKAALRVLCSHRASVKGSRELEKAYRTGLRFWKECYGRELAEMTDRMWANRQFKRAVWGDAVLLRYAPGWFMRHTANLLVKRISAVLRAVLPRAAYRLLKAMRRGPSYRPAVGRVRMGDLRRYTPISRCFGFDRGLPIDRYYIEGFLARHASDVRGRVLEIKDDVYTVRFGDDRVSRCDVLDIDGSNPVATIMGDLTTAAHIPSQTFDCIILTQTLQLIYDTRAAVSTLYRILKPGGVLLATVPGITKIEQDCPWYWSFTQLSAERLFGELFQNGRIAVKSYGNVFAAETFLQGLSVEDLRQEELDYEDPDYPVTITVRAVKEAEVTES